MKKLFSVLLIIAVFIVPMTAVGAMAEDEYLSKAVYLADFDTGTVIASKNENARYTIASMCKIMTLNLIFDEVEAGRLSLDGTIRVSETASGMGGSQAFLEANADYKAGELVKSIIIVSANDSCVAFAEAIAGSEDEFVKRMNDKAKALGMNNTLFANCTGLPKPTQYSCAKDVAKMFTELLKHKDYFRYSGIWMDEISHPEGRKTGLTNTNKLIRFYEGCDGGKTGYTSEAGHCLAVTAKRGGLRLIAVIISAPDSKTRFKEASGMLNYGFAGFTNKMIVDSRTPLKAEVAVKGGKSATVEVIPEKDYFSFSAKNSDDEFRIEFLPDKLRAPVKKGDAVGKLVVYKNNEEAVRMNCLANEDVESKPYFGYVGDVMREWSL